MSDPNAERAHRAKILVTQVVGLDPDARAAVLDEACGEDAGLRAEVQALLDSDRSLESLSSSSDSVSESPTPARVTWNTWQADADVERLAQVRSIFERVVDLDPEERTAALEEACAGDTSLLAAVRALLSFDAADDPVVGAGLTPPSAASLPSSDLVIGRVVDRYEVLGRLGVGGMATVYRVRHTSLGSAHALKVLSLGTPTIRERLRQEGRVQARLQHPNIVHVTDMVEVDGAPGLVMELVEGPALDQLLTGQQEPLALDEAESLASGILKGVAAAHAAGLVHRDLKPGNVLLATQDGERVPKIADFGLVKVVGLTGLGQLGTRSGVTMGTPAYMAPEQIEDSAGVDARADVFALGVILYELFCGERPFHGRNTMALFIAIAAGLYKAPRALRPDLPDHVDATIRAALLCDLDRRPQDGAALLEVWRGEAEPPALIPSTPSAPRGPLAATALIGIMAAGLWLASTGDPPPPEPAAPSPAASSKAPPPGPETPPPEDPVPAEDTATDDPDAPPEEATSAPELSGAAALPPETAAPVGPSPGPPPDVTFGHVRLEGAPRAILLVGEQTWSPGEVPPGTYEVRAFIGGVDPVDAGQLTVQAGGRYLVRCSELLGVCSLGPDEGP